MERAEKRELVASLQESFAGAGSIVVAHNAGLTVAADERLRVADEAAGGTVKVAKNRLAKLALKETEQGESSALFTGPTVVAFARSHDGAESRVGFRREEPEVRGSRRRNGEDRARRQRQGAGHDAFAGPAARHARRHAQAARDAYRFDPAGTGGQIARVFAAYAEKDEARIRRFLAVRPTTVRTEQKELIKWLISPKS